MSYLWSDVLLYQILCSPRGCSLTHSARTPPARDRNNFLGGDFLGGGFFGGQGIFCGSGDFLRGRGFFGGQGIFLCGGGGPLPHFFFV